MKSTATTAVLAVLVALAAQSHDPDTLARIRQEGLDRSQALATFATLTDQFGPRLTGSPAYKEAAEWARDRLRAFGLENARLEPWRFGRGWVLEHLVVEMVAPRYMPLIGYAEAWSASTSGEPVATPVLVGGKSVADVEAMRGDLRGAIVFLEPEAQFLREDRPQPTATESPVRIGAPPNPGPRRSSDETRQILHVLHDAGVGAVVRTSAGEHGTVFVLGRDLGDDAVPSVVLAGEHYNLIARMVQRGIPVRLKITVQARFLTEDPDSYNVIADLPGSDPALKDEIVLFGAHLDSWHTATGASDNADGSAAVLEAMRILKAIAARPKRTIRVALWGGEEQGLLGSKAYVRQHLEGDANKATRDRHVVYFNIDPGMGPIYGWYLEGTEGIRRLFDDWLAPFTDLGARRNVLPGIGNTDHLSFRAAGVPGFNPVQDYSTYDVRTHHTNVDTYERVREQDLKQNAIVLAWFALQAANTSDRIPRPVEAGAR